MKKTELAQKLKELKELKATAAELDHKIDALEDEIKAVMAAKQLDEMEVGSYIVRWTPVISTRFDTSAFKRAYESLYKEFCKQTSSRRFVVS